MARRTLSAKQVLRIYRRDKYTCQYCGRTGVELEVDHKIPVSAGGSNNDDNLTTSCKKCNRRKKAEIWEAKQPDTDEEPAEKTLIYEWGGTNRLALPNTPETRELFKQLVMCSMSSGIKAVTA